MPFSVSNGLLHGKFGKHTTPAQKAAQTGTTVPTSSATKSSTSLFDSGQVGSVSDNDATFTPHDRADSSPVVHDPGTIGGIDNGLGSSDAAPGVLPSSQLHIEASGTSVHEQNGPDDAVPTFDIAPGQAFPGNVEGTQSTKAVDPDLQQNAIDAMAECIVAEASEDVVDFARIDALSDAAQALAPEDDGALPAYMSGDLI